MPLDVRRRITAQFIIKGVTCSAPTVHKKTTQSSYYTITFHPKQTNKSSKALAFGYYFSLCSGERKTKKTFANLRETVQISSHPPALLNDAFRGFRTEEQKLFISLFVFAAPLPPPLTVVRWPSGHVQDWWDNKGCNISLIKCVEKGRWPEIESLPVTDKLIGLEKLHCFQWL